MLNMVALTGRFGADPEIRSTQSGTSVCSFRLAVDRSYVSKDQQRETDWISCVAWRGTADFIGKYFHKGDMIAVQGRLQAREYDDKDGNRRYVTEVVVSEVNFCGSRRAETAQEPTKKTLASAVPPLPPVPAVEPWDGFEELTFDDFDGLPPL